MARCWTRPARPWRPAGPWCSTRAFPSAPRSADAAEALAREAGVEFEGLWLEAAPDVLRARVAARTGDASDADVAVLERQLGYDVGEVRWRTEERRTLSASRGDGLCGRQTRGRIGLCAG